MLTITPSGEDLLKGLESWSWIDFSGLEPVLISALGDVFFRTDEGGVVMLDTIEGKLVPLADDFDQFREVLNTAEVQEQLLFASLVFAAHRERGLALEDGQCFDFKIPPMLGGEISVDALEVINFVVKLNVAGQIHAQIKDLPPGTPIGKIDIKDV